MVRKNCAKGFANSGREVKRSRMTAQGVADRLIGFIAELEKIEGYSPGDCAPSAFCTVPTRGLRLRCVLLCGKPPATGSERNHFAAWLSRQAQDERQRPSHFHCRATVCRADIGHC